MNPSGDVSLVSRECLCAFCAVAVLREGEKRGTFSATLTRSSQTLKKKRRRRTTTNASLFSLLFDSLGHFFLFFSLLALELGFCHPFMAPQGWNN